MIDSKALETLRTTSLIFDLILRTNPIGIWARLDEVLHPDPISVIFPKSIEDVQAIVRLAVELASHCAIGRTNRTERGCCCRKRNWSFRSMR